MKEIDAPRGAPQARRGPRVGIQIQIEARPLGLGVRQESIGSHQGPNTIRILARVEDRGGRNALVDGFADRTKDRVVDGRPHLYEDPAPAAEPTDSVIEKMEFSGHAPDKTHRIPSATVELSANSQPGRIRLNRASLGRGRCGNGSRTRVLPSLLHDAGKEPEPGLMVERANDVAV